MPVFRTVSPAAQAKAILESNGKYAENLTGSTLMAGTVCSWTVGGTLQLGEADAISANTFAGVVYQNIPPGQFGLVIRRGKLPGVLVGLSPSAGQPVFLSVTPGLMTLTAPPEGDAVVRVGYAEPPDNTAGTATDLFIEFDLVSAF